MAVVTGMTATRMLAIEAASIVNGSVVDGSLVLTTQGGSTIVAGDVVGPAGADGAPGATGPTGPQGPAGADGDPGEAFVGTPIGLSQDLNNYETPGVFTQSNSFHGGTNFPSLLPGLLEVFLVPTIGVIQRFTDIYNPKYYYLRSKTSFWTAWTQVIVPKVAYIGVSATANQSIPNDVWTTIQWPTVYDHSTAIGLDTSTYTFSVSDGLFDTDLDVGWVANSTGTRGIRILVNDVVITEKILPAETIAFKMSASKKYYAPPPSPFSKFKYQVYQNSGASLNIVGDSIRSTSMSLTYLTRPNT